MGTEARPLTIKEYAVWANVTPWTVRQWIKQGKIRAQKLGGEWRIDPREVQTFAPDEPVKESL